MARKLAWLFVALIAIADLVLISTVLHSPGSSKAASSPATRSTAAYPAPEMITPTRGGNSISVAGPPMVAAAPNTALPALPGPAAAPTEGIQVLGESRDEEASPTWTPAPRPAGMRPAGTGDASGSARILLDVDVRGTIVRAVRGTCPSTTATALSVSRDAGASWVAVDAGVPQVLGVGALHDSPTWYVGTDETCRPVGRESTDGGETWHSGSVAGRWYLNPDPASTVVASPRLVADVGCVPLNLAAVDERRAGVACANGDVRVTGDGGDSWTTTAGLPGLGAVAFASGDRGFALVSGADCRAEVLRTDDGGVSWMSQSCLGDVKPRALAAAGDFVVAQVGSDLLVSRDTGRTWRTTAG
jgi:hypothetical protein